MLRLNNYSFLSILRIHVGFMRTHSTRLALPNEARSKTDRCRQSLIIEELPGVCEDGGLGGHRLVSSTLEP